MDVTSYALSKKYTQETSSEFGAVKGANCQISNTEIDSDGNTVITFKWVNTAGQERTSTATILKGAVGEKGVSISSVVINSEGHLICILSDGTEVDAGEIKAEEIAISSTDITIYIDYVNGSDDNDGLSEETPLKTFDFQKIASKYNKYTRFGFNLMSDYPLPVVINNASIVVIKSNGASASTPSESRFNLKGGISFGNVAEAFVQFVNITSDSNESGVLVEFQNCGIAYLGYSSIFYNRTSNGRAIRVLKCSGATFNAIEIKNLTNKALYGITVGTSCVYMLQGSKTSTIDESVDYGFAFTDGGGLVYMSNDTYKQITSKTFQDGIGAIFVDGQIISTKYENTYEGEKIDLQNKPTVKSSTPSGGAYTKPSGVTTAVQGGCAYGDKYIQLFNTGFFGIYSLKDFDKGTNVKTPLASGKLGSYDVNNHANSLTLGKNIQKLMTFLFCI